MRHYNEICEPYEYEKENAAGGIEIIRKMSDCINTDKSLLKLVRHYLSRKERENEDVQDEDED